MVCPYCNIEYTTEQPCFCLPPPSGAAPEPERLPAYGEASASPTGALNACRGNRID